MCACLRELELLYNTVEVVPYAESSKKLSKDKIPCIHCVVLCCVALSCALLCCAVLCCVVLCCAVLCCVVLYFVVLCCVVLCCVVLILLYCFARSVYSTVDGEQIPDTTCMPVYQQQTVETSLSPPWVYSYQVTEPVSG